MEGQRMKRNIRHQMTAAAIITVVGFAGWSSDSSATAKNFPPISNSQYTKECGTCHMAFPPQLLPARSWRQIMGGLNNHFGDSAQLDDAARQKLTEYLTSNSADGADNMQSMSVMKSIGPNETPSRITKVPYIAGLHAAVLDPVWGGYPHPKTLSECSVCHTKAEAGNYTDRGFTVTDEQFRGDTFNARR